MNRRTALLGLVALFAAAPAAPAQTRKPTPARAGAAKPDNRPLPVGTYEGALKVGGIDLRLVLHLASRNSAVAGTLDSPDQSAYGIPISGGAWKAPKLKIESDTVRGTWEGTLSADGKTLTGTWSQGGGSLPLTLRRVTAPTRLNRPQTPHAPYPYKNVEVAFDNPKATGVALAGTLTVPPGPGPFPCAIFITGSGAQDRDETLFEHKPFAVIADDLARRGIASLRCDDRGVGKSKGSFDAATSADFATDIAAAVAFARARPEIDPTRVGLIGHSEGGLIAPMVAADDAKIAFVVLLAGPGVDGEKILAEQSRLILKAQGVPEASLDTVASIGDRIRHLAVTESDRAVAEKKAIEELKKAGADAATATAQARALTSPWMRYFLRYDPAPTLARVHCPVLALNGSKDLQVPPAQNLPTIEKILREAGNTHVTIQELPGLNHLFQSCKTGAPTEYARLEETIAPDALKTIGEWVVRTTR